MGPRGEGSLSPPPPGDDAVFSVDEAGKKEARSRACERWSSKTRGYEGREERGGEGRGRRRTRE